VDEWRFWEIGQSDRRDTYRESVNCVATLEKGMSNVTRLHHALPLSPAINTAVIELDNAIAKAIDAAKAAGLPQGLVVSILHGHAQMQTTIMVS